MELVFEVYEFMLLPKKEFLNWDQSMVKRNLTEFGNVANEG